MNGFITLTKRTTGRNEQIAIRASGIVAVASWGGNSLVYCTSLAMFCCEETKDEIMAKMAAATR